MMKKIYFAPTIWADSSLILNEYKRQTPNSLGVWGNLEGTYNIEEADYVLIQDDTSDKERIFDKFNASQIIYISREALATSIMNSYPSNKCRHFSYWDNTGFLITRWSYYYQGYGGTRMTYDELVTQPMYPKSKTLTCILSGKTMVEGHTLRLRFAEEFLKKYN